MTLSKTDFADYLTCPKTFWLRRERPDAVAWAAPSAMQRTQMLVGQSVERESAPFMQANFGERLSRQTTFVAGELLARADYVKENADGSLDIFEVKASTKLKDNDGNDHIVDAAFQYLTATRSSRQVATIHIVHLDGGYTRSGVIDHLRLFRSTDVTGKVLERLVTLEPEIDAAVALLAQEEIDLDGCECRFRGANSRCEGFAVLNPGIAEESAHYLPGIRRQRLVNWGPSFDLRTIDPSDLSDRHQIIQRALLQGTPVIDVAALREFCDALSYPIYFYDYETTGPAIPPADGYRPYQAIPVQFSVHRLDADGATVHSEFLADGYGEELELIDRLEAAIGPDGSAMAWHMSFEKGCNARLAALHPSKAEFLTRLSDRTADLEVPFQRHYVDWGFRGSSSIKKVLPVLAPDLQYDQSQVHDGTGAVEAWTRMIDLEAGPEKNDLRRQLLEYCHLDTLAMVRIFAVLKAIVSGN